MILWTPFSAIRLGTMSPPDIGSGPRCPDRSITTLSRSTTFGPTGPVIASRSVIPNAEGFELKTWAKGDGDLRRNCHTDDIIFGTSTHIKHLSQGMTLRKDTMIMTRTPKSSSRPSTQCVLVSLLNGVAAFLNPRNRLKDGGTVKLTVEGIGTIENKMALSAE
jgi:2-keto-4-pentenoate hydratase/2-oxohepta-3-ene-1,7-dioic acid hydratase in catechol pathway